MLRLTYNDSNLTAPVIIPTGHHGPHCVVDQSQDFHGHPLNQKEPKGHQSNIQSQRN